MKCKLCGHRFLKSEAGEVCGSCVLHPGSCGLVRCPNCGYEWPPESRLLSFFSKLFRRR